MYVMYITSNKETPSRTLDPRFLKVRGAFINTTQRQHRTTFRWGGHRQ